MFSRRAKQSTPAPLPTGRPWTAELFNRTFWSDGLHSSATIYLHSLRILHETMAATDQFPARTLITQIALQGVTPLSQIFCEINVVVGSPESTKVGVMIFNHHDNPNTNDGGYIASLSITLVDHSGTLISMLRDAFSGAGEGRRVETRLAVSPELSWDAINEGFSKGTTARLDLAHFYLWESWGTPIDPSL